MQSAQVVFTIAIGFRFIDSRPTLLTPTLVLQGLRDMTITRDGLQRVPLMNGIGGARFVNNLTDEEVIAAGHAVQHYAQSLECPEAIESPFFEMDHFPSPVLLAN